jgi:para-nitrobenzyl esterase
VNVTTEGGTISGVETGGLHLFRNIPYAAPPFGSRRFLPPQPVENWDGVRDGARSGPAAPQPIAEKDPLGPLYSPADTGEDCLTLEIWTPDPGHAGLPVMVHIHGGAYVGGAGSLLGYSGRKFARDGIVHVGINYRLGIDGFLYLGEGRENLGLRDQVAALEWVQRNIAKFGGDPSRVTIFGQSGGGVSVMLNLAMPASQGLFAAAIAQSGCSMPSIDAGEATRFTRQVAKRLRIEPTAEAFSTVSLERTTVAATRAMTRFALGLLRSDPRSLLISPFRAVHGTGTLPVNPFEAAGTTPSVPLVAGTARNDTGPIVEGIAALGPGIAPLITRGLRRALRIDGAMAAAYRNGPRHIRTRSELVEAAWTDWGFRIPTIRLLDARPEPSWLYEFRWQSDLRAANTGAFHGIDVPFSRDTLDDVIALGEPARAVFGNHPSQEVATAMHSAWVAFATTGDPGWPQYETPTRSTMIFDAPGQVLSDAAGVERVAWDGKR